MEPGEALGRGQAGYCGCWSLVPSAQGWFPEWRPAGGPCDTCWRGSGRARVGPRAGETCTTQNLTCQSQGLCPDSQQDCQGDPAQTLPTSTHSWETVPGTPTSPRRELLDPPLSLDPPQEAEPRLPTFWAWGF